MEEKKSVAVVVHRHEEIIWIPTGLAARILGCAPHTVTTKYFGSVRCLELPSGHRKWALEDVQKLADELRVR